MSMLLMVEAMRTNVGNSARKLVLLKLADNANDQGECWPSYQYIADQCEMSKRSAMIHVGALCKSGLLKKVTRKGPKGNSSNVYVLTLGGENIAPPGADSAPPSEYSALPPSEESAPGISHSFEPVNEPTPPNPPKGECAQAENQDSKPEPKEQRATAQQVADAYNEILGGKLPKCVAINDKRKRAIKRFLDNLKNPTEKAVRAYLRRFLKVARPFHFGENDRHWRADFDYVIKGDTVIKVREESL